MTLPIAVLGAGPMGLAVAYQLARDGQRVVLYEADDRVGGMTACFDFGGVRIERYYHFHCTSDAAFFELLNELGLADRMRWVATRMGYWYEQRLQPWGNPVALLSFRGLDLISKLRYGLHAWLCIRRKDWKPLDSMEATGWIRRAVGERAYSVLWDRLFAFKFYQYAGNLSAAWIWSRIRRIGSSRYSLMREKLGYFEGGSDAWLAALKTELERMGVDIRLATPVREVVIDGGRLQGVRTDAGLQQHQRVISTVPLPFLPLLMPGLPPNVLDMYRAQVNIGVVCVIVKMRHALTENFWLNTNDPEMDIPGIVEYSNLRVMEPRIAYVPFYMPNDHQEYGEPDQLFTDKVRRYFQRINPKLIDSDFIEFRVSRYRYAQPICRPGHLDSLPPAKLPVRGLWAADTSYYYPEDRGISESIAYGRSLAKQALAQTA